MTSIIKLKKSTVLFDKQISKDSLVKVGLKVDDEGYVIYKEGDQAKYEQQQKDAAKKIYLEYGLFVTAVIGSGYLGYKICGPIVVIPAAFTAAFVYLIIDIRFFWNGT